MSTIPINDKNELLKWLTEYYLENDSLEDNIYNELLKVYKPFLLDNKAIELYDKICKKEAPDSIENMSFLVLEQIISIMNKDMNELIIEMLYEYHFRYNKSFIIDLYNKLLNDNIGRKVNVVVKKPKENTLVNGKLNSISEKESITLEEKVESLVDGTVTTKENVIPFVGYKSYIKVIKNDNDRILYLNDSNLDPNMLNEDADIQEELDNLFDDKYIVNPRTK